MSEDIIIALITVGGSLIGSIIGAYATVKAAGIKIQKPTSQTISEVKKQKPHWIWGMLGGAIVGAGVTLVVLVIMGIIPTSSPTPTQAIAEITPDSPSEVLTEDAVNTPVPKPTNTLISPTNTPLPPTHTPLPPTPTVANVSYYDNFNNTAFDGEYNKNLWKYEGTQHVDVKQENGALTFTTNTFPESGSNSLTPSLHNAWSLEQLALMETKMKLDSSKRGQGSFIQISAYTDLSGRDWWTECMLNNSEFETPFFFCDIHSGERTEDNEPVFEYQTPVFFDLEYDIWYTARIEIDPDTTEIAFYLNDKLIGSHIPKDATQLQQTTFSLGLGSWADANDTFVGYFDDVRFGQ